MAVQEGNTSLFGIFFLAIYSLVLIPYTIYRLCNPSEEAIKPWEAGNKRKPSALVSYIRRIGTSTVVALVVAWAIWVFIVYYVSANAKDLTPFDPFEILGVSREASKQDVSGAYRKMALKYHPDRNPDPEAAKYFAEYITKAYKALTDQTARENYEKYGHPDGQQAMRMSIALPEWLLNSDSKRAPWVLGLLVVGGILLPLILAARYLMQSTRFAGPNAVMAETMEIFYRSKFGVKESQGLAKIPDTLIMAMEFITMSTPADQAEGLEELRKTTLRLFPELKDNKQAWFRKRKASIVKAHMLLLAHLDRQPIPASLAADYRFVVAKCAMLLEEMVKIANLPRLPGQTCGWLAPTLGSLEMLQCLTQGVSQASRKNLGSAGKATSDSSAVLLQLPHMSVEVLRKIVRKRIRTLPDLLQLSSQELDELLTSSGLSAMEAQDVATALAAVPTVKLEDVDFQQEGGEGDIVQGDVITCTAHVTLHRASHAHQAFKAPAEGQAVQAYAPAFPGVREERWWFVLASVHANQVVSISPVSLLRAEAAGVAQKLSNHHLLANGSSDSEGAKENGHKADAGSSQYQTVELKFQAPAAGKYDLTLLCVSDCWVGCDVALPMKLRVSEQTKAQREERLAKAQAAASALEPPVVSDDEDADAPTANGGEEEDEDGAVSGEGEWDSEETGTDETGDDTDTEEVSEKLPLKKAASQSENDSSSSSTFVTKS